MITFGRDMMIRDGDMKVIGRVYRNLDGTADALLKDGRRVIGTDDFQELRRRIEDTLQQPVETNTRVVMTRFVDGMGPSRPMPIRLPREPWIDAPETEKASPSKRKLANANVTLSPSCRQTFDAARSLNRAFEAAELARMRGIGMELTILHLKRCRQIGLVRLDDGVWRVCL